jgi:hypothetical protein
MTPKRLLALGFIFGCTAVAWFILGHTLWWRTDTLNRRLNQEVTGNWGAPIEQTHPSIYYLAPTGAESKRLIQPVRSRIAVDLQHDPKKKGLLWYRTYRADFQAEYLIRNPTPIRQTIYVRFDFPAVGIRYDRFTLAIGEQITEKAPAGGGLTESILLGPGQEVPLRVSYQTTGLDRWQYSLHNSPRVRDFVLRMKTDFAEIDMPAGAESPTGRTPSASGWDLVWEYSDVIGARAVGMDMPAVVNPGPVAARITYYAPVSLLFFFTVLLMLGMVQRVDLHPMNYFFLAAGYFAFQLLFAYLVDLMSVWTAFLVAAAVSVTLVSGYLARVAGMRFARLAAVAQLAYLVLFSYSFFFRGLTGITITVGAVLTLALLMFFTAKINWALVFGARPPSLPTLRGGLESTAK